jgi:hypothetical protein
LLSPRIIWLWENMLGPVIDQDRKITDGPTQYDHIEYLYHELKRRQQQLTARPQTSYARADNSQGLISMVCH